jgi:hypothetical protein
MDKLGTTITTRVVKNWQSSATSVGMALLGFLEYYKDTVGSNTKTGLYSALGVLILGKLLGNDAPKPKE